MTGLRVLATAVFLTAATGLPAWACVKDVQPATFVAFKPGAADPADEAVFEATLQRLTLRVLEIEPDRVVVRASGDDALSRRRVRRVADVMVGRAAPPRLMDIDGAAPASLAPDTAGIWLDVPAGPGCVQVPPSALSSVSTPSSGTAPK